MSKFKKSSNSSYETANIMGGKFHVKTSKENPQAVERVNKLGNTVYELITNELEGVYIHDVGVHDGEYGKNLNITTRLKADRTDKDNEFFVVSCSLNSPYAYTFLNRVLNLNPKTPITLKVFEIENTNKDTGEVFTNRMLVIYQNGKSIDKIWSSENSPVPKAEIIKDKKGKPVLKNNKQQYNDAEKIAFLEDFIENEVQPIVRAFSGIKEGEPLLTDSDGEPSFVD